VKDRSFTGPSHYSPLSGIGVTFPGKLLVTADDVVEKDPRLPPMANADVPQRPPLVRFWGLSRHELNSARVFLPR
jgi:hypothetical protein